MHYGDLLGHDAGIFAYEVDGLEHTFRYGLPYPTHEDGAPHDLEIIGLSPAVFAEEMHVGEGHRYYLKDGGIASKARLLSGEATPEAIDRHQYGCGVIVSFPKGKGEVFCAGASEWVSGLAKQDFYVQGVTRNVLDRFLRLQDEGSDGHVESGLRS